jgi:hypothetical protein
VTLGFVMLCHTALDRAAQVARHWAERGCPVVMHVDRRVPDARLEPLVQLAATHPNVRLSPRVACEWGSWGLVAATQIASTLLLHEFPDVGHVYLVSGACLPLRPVAGLVRHLAAHPDTDFIESVTIEDVGWTKGGLDHERFTLRFPFSWKRQRRLFDLAVAAQRALRLQRAVPPALVPHLGSQWWCLTRRTLSAILESPERARNDSFFRQVWIPDESYFQTLVRRHARHVESRSLTLSKFDFQGKPHVLYDDHLDLLRRSDHFVARKAWPQADGLYRALLGPDPGSAAQLAPAPGKIDRILARSTDRRTKGRPGLFMQSRFPAAAHARTAGPYSVLQGLRDVVTDADPWIEGQTGARVHGHLFGPHRAEFAQGQRIFRGGLSDAASLRDYDPVSFLGNVLWNSRGERQCFHFGPSDVQAIAPFLAADANARVTVVTGAWAVGLFRSGRSAAEVRAEAARLQKTETAFVSMLRAPSVRAQVRIWTLADFLEAPVRSLQAVIDEIGPRPLRHLLEVPRLVDLTGFGEFLQALRNEGMKPVLTGEFPMDEPLHATAPGQRGRLVVVK